MNIIDFTFNGGYRLKQFTLRKMQEATIQVLKAFVAFCNVPETGNYIISGLKVVGPNITAGYAYIDGELCAFAQTAGDATTLIKKVVVTQSLAFKNGSNPTVFRFTSAAVDLVDGAALSTFIRVSPVFDANYVHTDNNFTALLLAKLLGIESGAQVNVKPSWTAPEADANGILDKPEGNLQTYLAKNTFMIGDLVGTTDNMTIPLGIDVGTVDYHVDGCLIGKHPGTDNGEVKANWIVKRKTAISFDIIVTDYSNSGSQDFEFDWNITPY